MWQVEPCHRLDEVARHSLWIIEPLTLCLVKNNSEIPNPTIVATLENVKHGFWAIVSWIKNFQSDKVQNATKMLPLFNNRQSPIKRRHCSINWSPLVTLQNGNPHSRRQLPVDAYPRSNFFSMLNQIPKKMVTNRRLRQVSVTVNPIVWHKMAINAPSTDIPLH